MTKQIAWQDHVGEALDAANGFTVIECDACRFKHIVPIPTPAELEHVYRHEYYATEKPLYIQRHLEDREWLDLVYAERFDAFERLLDGRSRRPLLDLGAGPGLLLQHGAGPGGAGGSRTRAGIAGRGAARRARPRRHARLSRSRRRRVAGDLRRRPHERGARASAGSARDARPRPGAARFRRARRADGAERLQSV